MKMFRKASVQNLGSAALALLTLFAAMAPSAIAKPRPVKPAGQPTTVRWDAETAYTNYGSSLVYIANNEGLGILEHKQPPEPARLKWDAETAYTNY